MIEDFRIGDWLIQPLQNSLSRHGTQVKVDPKAMQVLVRLAQNSGEIVTKEELIESVWEGAFVTDEVLTNAIWELRRALGDDAKNPKYIRTAPRKGYQLIADYRPAEDVQSETSSAHTKQETERVIVSVEGNDRVSISQQKDRLKIDVENGSSGERIHLDVPVRRPFLSLAGILVVVLALLVGLNVWGLRDRLFGGTSSPIESLAVLPLENLSGDPEQEYFAEGMTEALIADLAKIGALRIISRQSVMQFKGTDSPLPEIAQALSVDAVVIGSVLRSGDRVRITTQLVQANPEKHLWADGYERDLRDILTLQSEVARAIAQEIRVKLTPQEEAGLAWARPVDPEAHEAYFKGRYHYDKFSPDSWDKAIEYFKLAIQKDPDFAPAHAWLAQSYFQLGFLQLKPVGEVMGDAKAAALKAVELDETIFQAHIVLARIRFHYERNWLAAQNEIKRAIELSPGSGQAKGLYALYLGAVGRLDEAISEAKQARELDPLWLPIKTTLAWLYYVTGNNDEAIEQCREALDMTPSFFWAHFFLWRTLEQKMMYEEAVEQCQSMFALLGNHDVAEAVERRYRESGYKSAMGMAARGMARQLKSREVSPFLIALMYIHAGEMDQAFQWTERAYDERDTWMFSLKMDPAFAPLRDDPRFQELLRRMNYPE